MHARSFQDLTVTELERLGIEIARLQDERQKRQQTLESALSDLRSQCDELGEDAQSLAAEAHPTLLRLYVSLSIFFLFLRHHDHLENAGTNFLL